ncbi:MAG: hypothetical protein PHS44_02315 [Candidatus Dojkabacteria bacterium]|nr:hypothetical protein [Candidatus Dojkabacteria bacterium]
MGEINEKKIEDILRNTRISPDGAWENQTEALLRIKSENEDVTLTKDVRIDSGNIFLKIFTMKSLKFMGAFIVVLLLCGIVSLTVYYATQKKDDSQLSVAEIRDSVIENLDVGFTVLLKKDWSVKIIDSGDRHNFLAVKTGDRENQRIEVEAASSELANISENSLIKYTSSEKKQIDETEVTLLRGIEEFGDGETNVLTSKIEDDNKSLTVRVFGGEFESSETIINEILRPIVEDVKVEPSVDMPDIVEGLQYREIEVMGDILVDEITNKDVTYKDGYARGYSFVAYKGQRLAIWAEETSKNKESYIRSQLFDSTGRSVSKEMDTHMEFSPMDTGTYFLLVYTFGKREGEIGLRIDDHDQLECVSIIKYEDGTEVLNDPERGSGYFGKKAVGYVYQCPNPIEIKDNDTLLVDPVERAGQQLSDRSEVNLLVWSCGKKSCFEHIRDDGKVDFACAEDEGKQIEFSFTQLNVNRVLITPKKGLFGPNLQVALSDDYYWFDRFWTTDDPGLEDEDGAISEEEEEIEDEVQCTAEGYSYAVVPDYLPCCSGLTPISCDKPGTDGICSLACVGSMTCSKCGNGVCGLGENKCNCPEDCDNSESCNGMSLTEAKTLVKYIGDCSDYGTVDYSNPFCNVTMNGTWAFYVLNTGHEDLCEPTCYVNTTTKKVEFFWQCTGAEMD